MVLCVGVYLGILIPNYGRYKISVYKGILILMVGTKSCSLLDFAFKL